jgi:hypothetical protein
MKKKVVIPIVISLFFIIQGKCQEASLSINNLEVCGNSEVEIPVTMENFYNVGAVSLYIGYDTTHLEFISLENIHPNFGGLLYNNMNYPVNQIGISWTSLYGTTVTSGIFFEMKFMYKGGQTEIDFNPGCEITTLELDPITVVYTSGTVSPMIDISVQPVDQQVVIGQSAYFTIESTGGESFQWQKQETESDFFEDIANGDTYQGVTTQTLQIVETDVTINGYRYRCEITSGNCTTFSEDALLTVEGIIQDIELKAGWNSLSSYIDPTDTDLDVLLDGIMNSLVIMITDNGFYYPAANTNTIGNFDPYKGYSIKLSNNETLSISGIRSENNQINLPQGWSYLPVIAECNIQIQDLFIGQLQDVIIIKEIAGNNVFWPENNINTLQVLETGKSYLIKADNPVDVVFPDCQ